MKLYLLGVLTGVAVMGIINVFVSIFTQLHQIEAFLAAVTAQ